MVIQVRSKQPPQKVATPSPSSAPKAIGRPKSPKVVISLRLEPEIIEKFRATGHGWQARMNDVLKAAKIP
jgi:uncharacterized protein (DUF4415 family)